MIYNKINKFNKILLNKYYSTTVSNVIINNKDYLKSSNGIWELIVGIEVHAQTKSKEKLFSNSLNIGSMEGFKANSRVSYVDASFPGSLPVLNEKCVEQAIKTGLAINGTINKYSYFDRKHYFYQDLPQGYQITQLNEPIVKGGTIEIQTKDGREKNIRVSHIQLEQDSGKSIHDQHPTKSLVDLNRAGIGLMEIVSQPDFTSSEQVGLYILKLQHLLKHIGSSDANMQFGEMRCDVNISVHKPDTPFGTRVELKNMISSKAIVSSIDAEVQRQINILEQGGVIKRETRGFNQDTGETYHLRTKEDEVDYRFFPDPDLPPLIISQERIDTIRSQLGELPQQLKNRLIKQYSLSDYDASLLIQDLNISKFFEQSIIFENPTTSTGGSKVKLPRDLKKITSFLLRDVFSWLNQNNITDFSTQVNLTISQFTQLIDLIEQGYCSSNIGKSILFQILNGDKRTPKEIIDSQGLSQISDDSFLEDLINQLLASHQKEVDEYHAGKIRVYKFFIGEIMKKTKGRSNPDIVNNLLKLKLENLKK